tara:strand:- start:47 stop:358 length:312 start_codon:yes stop_codon:yes gene_type:complete
MTAFVANTNVLELRGLQLAITEAYLNNATVSVTVKDDCGDNVSGQTWPATMNYVSASNGDYRAILLNTVALQSGKKYFAEISATGVNSEVGFWRYSFRPQTRQ